MRQNRSRGPRRQVASDARGPVGSEQVGGRNLPATANDAVTCGRRPRRRYSARKRYLLLLPQHVDTAALTATLRSASERLPAIATTTEAEQCGVHRWRRRGAALRQRGLIVFARSTTIQA